MARPTPQQILAATHTTIGKLKAGDQVVNPTAVKTVRRVDKARKPGYVVVTYTDGTTGGGHVTGPIKVLRA
jgi:hypothetical protein